MYVPSYYYDLLIEIDYERYLVVDTLFPVWLSDYDFETEWVKRGHSLSQYREMQSELENDELITTDEQSLSKLLHDPVEFYRLKKKWLKFKQDYIQKTKQNLIEKYDMTLYKNGKWLITVVDTTVKSNTDEEEYINKFRNLNHCTSKLNVKEIVLNKLQDEYTLVKLFALIRDSKFDSPPYFPKI